MYVRGDGDGGRPARRGRTWWDVMHPEGSEGTWRDLPGLLWDSLKLVWSAGRNTFILTSTLQLLTAVGIAVQLFVSKAVLDEVLGAGDNISFSELAPVLTALVAVSVTSTTVCSAPAPRASFAPCRP
jgi:hypothetical protein